MAKIIIAQYGGPDGELGAALRYLSQRFTMVTPQAIATLNDVGTEESNHGGYKKIKLFDLLTNNLTLCKLISRKRNNNYQQDAEVTMSRKFSEAQKEDLITILTNELKMLRSKVEISQQELANRLGVSRQTYGAIEGKTQKMTWSNFLALLLIFTSNESTAKIIDWIEAYPPELKQYLSLTDSSANAVGKDVKKVKSDKVKPSITPLKAIGVG